MPPEGYNTVGLPKSNSIVKHAALSNFNSRDSMVKLQPSKPWRLLIEVVFSK